MSVLSGLDVGCKMCYISWRSPLVNGANVVDHATSYLRLQAKLFGSRLTLSDVLEQVIRRIKELLIDGPWKARYGCP